MLSQKFGPETVNYFAGSPLNRLSFLRSNNAFLSSALTHPSTCFLLFKDLAPLAYNPSKLACVTYDEVKVLIGENPFEKTEKDLIKNFNSSITLPLVLFLGINDLEQEGFENGIYKGKPYFAVDVTPRGTLKNQASHVIETLRAKGLDFVKGRLHMTLGPSEAAIYAQACSLLDWNARNPFCAGCGQPTLSVNAGGKRTCPPTDYASLSVPPYSPITLSSPRERPPCITRAGVSNLSFPRTDPTVITAVISHKGDRILLGRQKRWPPNFYSTLAGFVEAGESIEQAVRREVWEESGVTLGRVVIHSTQPWPFPANLMIGAISQALPDGETIHLEHDPELEDAKWFSLDELREALKNGDGSPEKQSVTDNREAVLKLPPKTAIANRLLTAVLEDLQLVQSKPSVKI
ncbi:putative NADH pyrophosphatase [Golovinomyces cichoracearum]|uniref:NAD(+) diphosphatase n=1 Tax=Golovinomyces cichoracearum TaxID=62708 RepID=A0A420IAB3_9PEZI|nr:putative NADH pyrophosphatase [Golovinomyces cichoracearum]